MKYPVYLEAFDVEFSASDILINNDSKMDELSITKCHTCQKYSKSSDGTKIFVKSITKYNLEENIFYMETLGVIFSPEVSFGEPFQMVDEGRFQVYEEALQHFKNTLIQGG